MNRLQKKCFIGSALVHLLLLVVLLVGAAFLPAPVKPEFEPSMMVLTDIPDIIVDQDIVGGNGVPVRQNAAPSQPAPTPTPVVPPPEVKRPAPVEPPPKQVEKRSEPVAEKEPAPEDDQEPENAQETENKFVEKPKKKEPRKIQVNISQRIKKDPIKKNTSDDDRKAREAKERHEREVAEAEEREAREARAQAEADRRARAEAIARVGSKFSGMRESLGSGTDISITGGSGPAYAGYSLVIKKIYDDAWRRPGDASDNSTVKVEVTISRDGRVLSSKIISKSSNSALVKSVKEALDRVRNVPPFPAGATDTERTFRINYNLKSKTDIG